MIIKNIIKPIIALLLFSILLSCNAADETVYLVKINTQGEDFVYSSIQGVLAQKDISCYLVKKNDKWEKTIRDKDGIFYKNIEGLDDFYAEFADKLGQYILCDPKNVSIGATVAGPQSAFVISPELLGKYPAIKNHSEEIFSVCDKDEYWLLDYVKAHLNDYDLSAITQQNPKNNGALIDFAIARKYICIVCQDQPELIKEFYQLIDPNSPKYGFGTPYHNEKKDVSLGAEYGLYTVPCANTMNLSFFSQNGGKQLEQARPEICPSSIRKSGKAHYLMIMMSDGDNLNWTINGCITNGRYLGNDKCGQWPLNWMYTPQTWKAGGSVHNHYMKNRPQYNYYMGAVSGEGYTYPSVHKDLKEFAAKTGKSLKKCGLDYTVIMDLCDFRTREKELLSTMIEEMPNLKGIYYMDYGNYAKWKGDSYMIGDIPVHSFRYRMWLPMNPLEEIAEKINASSKNPEELDAYSSVVVHAWSYGVDDIERFINLLDEDVVLVNGAQYMELLKNNVLEK